MEFKAKYCLHDMEEDMYCVFKVPWVELNYVTCLFAVYSDIHIHILKYLEMISIDIIASSFVIILRVSYDS